MQNKNEKAEQELLLQVRRLEFEQEAIGSEMKKLEKQQQTQEVDCRRQLQELSYLREKYARDHRMEQAINDKQAILNAMQRESADLLSDGKKQANNLSRRKTEEIEETYRQLHEMKEA